ncbi:type I DNA topoisomerase [Tichowtungia aerotolerans]|uniref:DNA topoisomerase 1 n=1 Tax=Tichowtungia aerotolerans TaxID=2697043 RepID=A0A6P1M457_9BACT|nr:type I DNA topoisomerase [Tichowtungia aerotolerans]QHI68812.1 type I DNA topoisomerase [Tichowtungia aerotolerans]
MAKKLVIVESPAKAKTINKYLGDDYIVKASMGHVRDLPPKKLGVDVDNRFTPEYVNTTGRAKVITELKAAAKKCDHVYLAPDPDREGEAIAWHLFELLKEFVPEENFSRVTYNEITKSAIEEAFANPSEMDMNRVNSQQARRVLDRLVGFKVSPLLWKQIKGGVSAGRVQSVALRLVCEREKEIQEFKPEEYWVLGANVRKQVEPLDPFVVKLARINGEKAEIKGGEQAEKIRAELEAGSLHVARVIEKTIQRKARAPFITSTIQQAASSVCGFAPSRTMRIAQSLYENGLITYMRTDSFNIAKSAQEECAAFVASEYGDEYLPKKPNVYKSKGGAQEAHEAIRPTDVSQTPTSVSGLEKDEAKLYKLVWERFVASQMVPAKIARRTAEVETDSENTYLFRATASEVAFPGYMRASGIESAADKKKEGEEDDAETKLPPLSEGENLDCIEWTGEQKFTKPPARYSEPSLIRALEENGVGRPSTYAQTLSTIEKREYVNKEKRQLVPTESGLRVNDFLVSSLDPLFNVKFTAEMEEKLDRVEEGTVEWTDMMSSFYNQFLEWLEGAKDMAEPEETDGVLKALEQVKEWDEPVKRGRRTYDDSEIVKSVREKFQEDGKITARQQQMIFRMACKYIEQMPQEIINELKLEKPEAPRTETGKKVAYLEEVEFDEPRKVGRRTYDDGKFVKSLKQQVQSGKRLSDRQVAALDSLLVKYSKQIPNFEQVKEDMGLKVKDDGEVTGEISRLMELCKSIETWNPPVKRGNREFNDQDFYSSLSSQFEAKGTLSPRQVAAMKKMIGRYASQIPTYEAVRESLGLPVPKAAK